MALPRGGEIKRFCDFLLPPFFHFSISSSSPQVESVVRFAHLMAQKTCSDCYTCFFRVWCLKIHYMRGVRSKKPPNVDFGFAFINRTNCIVSNLSELWGPFIKYVTLNLALFIPFSCHKTVTQAYLWPPKHFSTHDIRDRWRSLDLWLAMKSAVMHITLYIAIHISPSSNENVFYFCLKSSKLATGSLSCCGSLFRGPGQAA